MKESVLFLDELQILYVAGNNAVILNIENKSQRFFAIAETDEAVTALCLSTNRKYLAVATRGEERLSANIYEVSTLRKRKSMILDAESKVQLVCCISYLVGCRIDVLFD